MIRVEYPTVDGRVDVAASQLDDLRLDCRKGVGVVRVKNRAGRVGYVEAHVLDADAVAALPGCGR